jgi:hypothetical protein
MFCTPAVGGGIPTKEVRMGNYHVGWLWSLWCLLGGESPGCTPLLFFIVMMVVCGLLALFFGGR